jgi:hypothetical protein
MLAGGKFGKRFIDEYHARAAGYRHPGIGIYDAYMQYPRFPCHLIFDEEDRKLGPIGIPIVNDARFDASWSEDNLLEVNEG